MKLLAVLSAFLVVSSTENIITKQFHSFNKLQNNGGKKWLEPRIVGGATAMPQEFPYQAGLLIIMSHQLQTSWCGGSIIKKNYVLTAAHCIQGALSALVIVGTHSTNVPEFNSKMIAVKSTDFTIHPQYNRTLVKNDIALIKLPEDLTFTKAIQPISLPPQNLTDEKLVDKIATASGWGWISDRLPGVTHWLQFVNLEILDPKVCQLAYNTQLAALFTSNNICANTVGKRSVCKGDSGGPLALNNDDGTKTLIGVASYVHFSGCESEFPAVFTKVTSYLTWISSITGDES